MSCWPFLYSLRFEHPPISAVTLRRKDKQETGEQRKTGFLPIIWQQYGRFKLNTEQVDSAGLHLSPIVAQNVAFPLPWC